MNTHKNREALCDMGHDESILFDCPNFDDAIVGVTYEGRVVYDYDAMVKCLMEDQGMDEDEAVEFIEYNTIRALPYEGEEAPIVMNRIYTDEATRTQRAIEHLARIQERNDDPDIALVIEILRGKA